MVAANLLRARREATGLSQVTLAEAAGVSRQSIGAIEAGRATPGVDVALRLAAALGCRVEDLFAAPALEPLLVSDAHAPPASARVALAWIGGRWVAYPLDGHGMRTSADALVERRHGARRGARLDVRPVRRSQDARDNVVLMGCAAGLGLLADRLNAGGGPGRFLWVARSSRDALTALAARQTHLAGVHLVDPKTGVDNVVDVRRLAPRRGLALVTLARWEAGLVTARGNPKRIRTAADLGRRGLRLAGREEGSGARRLLERELRRAGLAIALARTATVQAPGHLEVAQAVALGAADAGVATRDAAIAFGLDFVPLAEERYDLALAEDNLADPRLQRIFDLITGAAMRRELSSLGYDVRCSGERVALGRRR